MSRIFTALASLLLIAGITACDPEKVEVYKNTPVAADPTRPLVFIDTVESPYMYPSQFNSQFVAAGNAIVVKTRVLSPFPIENLRIVLSRGETISSQVVYNSDRINNRLLENGLYEVRSEDVITPRATDGGTWQFMSYARDNQGRTGLASRQIVVQQLRTYTNGAGINEGFYMYTSDTCADPFVLGRDGAFFDVFNEIALRGEAIIPTTTDVSVAYLDSTLFGTTGPKLVAVQARNLVDVRAAARPRNLAPYLGPLWSRFEPVVGDVYGQTDQVLREVLATLNYDISDFTVRPGDTEYEKTVVPATLGAQYYFTNSNSLRGILRVQRVAQARTFNISNPDRFNQNPNTAVRIQAKTLR